MKVSLDKFWRGALSTLGIVFLVIMIGNITLSRTFWAGFAFGVVTVLTILLINTLFRDAVKTKADLIVKEKEVTADDTRATK